MTPTVHLNLLLWNESYAFERQRQTLPYLIPRKKRLQDTHEMCRPGLCWRSGSRTLRYDDWTSLVETKKGEEYLDIK